MVVSDAQTPDDFQIEIIDELNKEVRTLDVLASSATTKKAKEKFEYARNILRNQVAFIASIKFNVPKLTNEQSQLSLIMEADHD